MSENRNRNEVCGEVRLTVAAEIVQQASALHQRAQLLSERTRSRLEAISRPAAPVETRKSPDLKQAMPPLFNELREHFQSIDSYLHEIEEALDRVEL